MKMNLGKRLVLLVHWLLSVIACLMAVFFCIWPDVIGEGFSLLYRLIGKRSADIFGGIVLALYVIFAVLSFVFILKKKQRDDDSGFITVISDDSGKTRIAVGAIEQMIRIAVHGIDGIAELKTGITNELDAISISVNVSVISGVHIPTVTANVQRTISNYIELNCGVAVRQVCVSVNALESPEDAGKRGRKKFGRAAVCASPAAIEEVSAKAVVSEEKPAAFEAVEKAPEAEAQCADTPVEDVETPLKIEEADATDGEAI